MSHNSQSTASSAVRVVAPCRLHFGFLAFEPGVTSRQFGGLGVMIDAPRLKLCARRAASFQIAATHTARVATTADLWSRRTGASLPPVQVDVAEAPAQHRGLGSGTQLALALGRALDSMAGLPARTAVELARVVGRGARSAVGVHGFDQGGFIFEAGKVPGTPMISPLVARESLPQDWRWLLVCPPAEVGRSGPMEEDSFRRLPAIPREISAELCRVALFECLPAAIDADARRLGAALTTFNRQVGECFAPVQGGSYASPRLARLVEILLALGACGAGQSSWGPTVFALTESPAQAESLAARLSREPAAQNCEVVIAATSNRGAVFEHEP